MVAPLVIPDIGYGQFMDSRAMRRVVTGFYVGLYYEPYSSPYVLSLAFRVTRMKSSPQAFWD